MALTAKEEAMHLEAKVLRMFKPRNDEERYVHINAMYMFFEHNSDCILEIVDKYLNDKAKGR